MYLYIINFGKSTNDTCRRRLEFWILKEKRLLRGSRHDMIKGKWLVGFDSGFLHIEWEQGQEPCRFSRSENQKALKNNSLKNHKYTQSLG